MMLSSSQYIPTLNRMGYMSSSLDEIQAAFVEHCATRPSGLFLDIGCGFGIATLPVIDKRCRIIACDLEEKHLDILEKSVPKQKRSFLTLSKGHFPNTITFPENYFDGINLSMVLHFLPSHTIEKALKEIFLSLKPGGQLFMTTSSPYQRALSPLIPIYEKKRFVDEWPGYIKDVSKYVPHRAHLLPKENIVFCINELTRLILKFDFYPLKTTSFSREGIPSDLSLDGREYSGIICEKPREFVSLFRQKNKESTPMQTANII